MSTLIRNGIIVTADLIAGAQLLLDVVEKLRGNKGE